MIQGRVNELREAILPLVVGNASGQRQVINAVVDTGFNGFLTLPAIVITALGLSWTASDIVTLGDGREAIFDLYAVTVIWDGQYREIDVAESATEPLVGMALLQGYRLQIDVVEGGIVRIEKLPL